MESLGEKLSPRGGDDGISRVCDAPSATPYADHPLLRTSHATPIPQPALQAVYHAVSAPQAARH